MKTILLLTLGFIILLFSFNPLKAQNPTFTVLARNFTNTDSIGTGGISYDAITFDICIQHTNIGVSGPFEYALGQYYFNVSSAIGASTDYNYYLINGTGFSNPNALPRNPTYVNPDATSPTGASLRVNSNTVMGAGNGSIVSTTFPGIRVCTMRFKKKVGSFPLTSLNMTWRTALPNPFTKVFAYIGTTNTDISINGVYSIDSTHIPNFNLNNPPNNSINNPFSINFNWSKDNLSIAYVFQVFSDSLLTNIIINDTINIADTSKIVNGFSTYKKYFWRVGAKYNNGIVYYSSAWNFTTLPGIKLKVKIIPEGLYYSLFNLLSRKDTCTVYLRNIMSPFLKVDSAKSIVDSISFSGVFSFSNNAPAGTYYIELKHFNSIETWSKSGGLPMTLTDTSFYDFTTSASQAYGSNLKFKGGKYCIYSGDVNQDGITDGSDLMKIFNDSYIGLSGRFLESDLNGDNIIDAADMSVLDNNVYTGVVKFTP